MHPAAGKQRGDAVVGAFCPLPSPQAGCPGRRAYSRRGTQVSGRSLDVVSGMLVTDCCTAGGDEAVASPWGIQGSCVLGQSTGRGVRRPGFKSRLLAGGPEACGSPVVLQGDKPSWRVRASLLQGGRHVPRGSQGASNVGPLLPRTTALVTGTRLYHGWQSLEIQRESLSPRPRHGLCHKNRSHLRRSPRCPDP